ncbi:MAG: FAD-binding oxidoreductase [Rhodobacteraceae bacterium]|nr:FAD-binding oxidoreductase [Paracoccaceae bacterium]
MALNLLDANDRAGAYPNSWYAATAEFLAPLPALQEDITADVVIIGAGFTGLSAALHLAEAGRSVIVLEAQRVGFGASGRNGGQLGSGQRVEQPDLEARHGMADARKLWDLGEEAKALVRDLIQRHDMPNVHLKPGVAFTASTHSDVKDLHHYADHMQRHYDYPLDVLTAEAAHHLCPSPDYKGAIVDWQAGHLHPLNFVLGLARAALKAGVQIFEQSRVTSLETAPYAKATTEMGRVTADHLILACNGYLGNLAPQVAARVMPINNFIAATEPLGDRANTVLTQDIAVADSRFVVNYFRLSHDNRLLFGGGETYGYRFPSDIAALVRKPMSVIFPHLKDVQIDYAWGGTLAITMARLPYVTRLGSRALSASGYSGHGVGTATHAGMLMAKAIKSESDGFETLSRLPTSPFPGGAHLRSPLLALAMTWYSLRDRLGL